MPVRAATRSCLPQRASNCLYPPHIASQRRIQPPVTAGATALETPPFAPLPRKAHRWGRVVESNAQGHAAWSGLGRLAPSSVHLQCPGPRPLRRTTAAADQYSGALA